MDRVTLDENLYQQQQEANAQAWEVKKEWLAPEVLHIAEEMMRGFAYPLINKDATRVVEYSRYTASMDDKAVEALIAKADDYAYTRNYKQAGEAYAEARLMGCFIEAALYKDCYEDWHELYDYAMENR